MGKNDILILGAVAVGGLALLFLATRKDEKSGSSAVEKVAMSAGSAVGAAIPQFVLNAAFSGAGAFKDASYDAGYKFGEDTGASIRKSITGTTAATPISLPKEIYALPANVQAPIWDAAYRKQMDPLASVPIAGNLSAAWHNWLVGKTEW